MHNLIYLLLLQKQNNTPMKILKDIIYFIVAFTPLFIFCYMIGIHLSN